MATVGEFVRHVVTSAVFIAIGLGAVAYVRFRYDTGHRAFRRFLIASAGILACVAGLSLVSSVNEGRCPDDPTEFCRYNDSVPAMATIVGVFVIVALVVSRVLYTER